MCVCINMKKDGVCIEKGEWHVEYKILALFLFLSFSFFNEQHWTVIIYEIFHHQFLNQIVSRYHFHLGNHCEQY